MAKRKSKRLKNVLVFASLLTAPFRNRFSISCATWNAYHCEIRRKSPWIRHFHIESELENEWKGQSHTHTHTTGFWFHFTQGESQNKDILIWDSIGEGGGGVTQALIKFPESSMATNTRWQLPIWEVSSIPRADEKGHVAMILAGCDRSG